MFNVAVAFGFTDKGGRRLDPEEPNLVLKVVAHELRSVIVPESEFGGGVEVAEVGGTLADGFQGLEVRRSLDGLNVHPLDRANGRRRRRR